MFLALTYTLFHCFTKRGICIDKFTNNEYNFFKFTNCGLKIDIDKDTKESSVQIAKELLKIGMEVKQIIEITHLTREEIEKIIEEN